MAPERVDPRAGRSLRELPRVPIRPRAARPTPAASGAAAPLPALRLLRWPVLLTLGVTLLRLVGELRDWSPYWFSRLPGGGLSPIGIVWLVPLVGLYCGWQLQRHGSRPPSLALALAVPLGVLAIAPALPWLVNRMRETSWTLHLAAWAISSLFALTLAATAWPAIGRLLVIYALLARAPVVIVMAAAIWRRWQTHYDVVPPGFPSMTLFERWLWIGLLPQATIWIALSVGVGAVFGVIGWLVAVRWPSTSDAALAPGPSAA